MNMKTLQEEDLFLSESDSADRLILQNFQLLKIFFGKWWYIFVVRFILLKRSRLCINELILTSQFVLGRFKWQRSRLGQTRHPHAPSQKGMQPFRPCNIKAILNFIFPCNNIKAILNFIFLCKIKAIPDFISKSMKSKSLEFKSID